MAIPGEDWIDRLLARYGPVPVWSEDDVRGAIRTAVDEATDVTRAAVLRHNGEYLLHLVNSKHQDIKRLIAETARSMIQDAGRIEREVARKMKPPE